MHVIKCPDSLDLDDDTFLSQEVSNKISNHKVLIANFNPVLLFDLKVDLPKFKGQRIFINFLKKSRTEDVAHLMHATDDFFRYLIEP